MKKYARVDYELGGSFVSELEEALDFLRDIEVNCKYTFYIVDMTEEEYDELPEFMGF